MFRKVVELWRALGYNLVTIYAANSPKLPDQNLLGLGLLETLEKQKCDRTAHCKKTAKKALAKLAAIGSPAPIYPPTELPPTNQQ